VPYGNSIDDSLSYGTLKHFIDKAKNGQNITLFGEGGQKRSFIHIDDLSNILIQGAFSGKTDNGIFNISGPDVLSIKQVATMIAEKYGVQVLKVPWPKTEQLIETGDTIFNSTKLNEILEITYETKFYDWITKS
jgi:nucleoside-diphosphate-sugar epimerase